MAENKKFWDKLYDLWMTENLPVPDILLGDTNIVEDAIDRFPHRTDDEGATYALSRFKQLLGLKDGWRLTYPDEKAYTFTSTSRSSHSRIDRIYTPQDLFKKCRNWSISDTPGELTDHKLVSVEVYAPAAPFIGPGRYSIPLFLLRDKKFITYAIEEGEKVLNPRDELTRDDLQTRYKNYKASIRTFVRARAAVSVGATEQKKLAKQTEQ
jgi:hypothetical protein